MNQAEALAAVTGMVDQVKKNGGRCRNVMPSGATVVVEADEDGAVFARVNGLLKQTLEDAAIDIATH